MSLLQKSIWVFACILLLLLLVTFYPTPAFIFFAISLGSSLFLLQVFFVLKDDK